MAFTIIRDDITRVRADAVVNTANPDTVYGSGTDQAVYQAAGADKLLAERRKIGPIKAGDAAVTPAFALPAKYIIHTVGPVWQDGEHGERETVRSCYENSLRLAEEKGCESIVFPLIATGTYGFPKEEALQIAVSVFSEYLVQHDMEIILAVFDRKSFILSGKLFSGIKAYIDENYVEEKQKAYTEEGSKRLFGEERELRENAKRRGVLDTVRSASRRMFPLKAGRTAVQRTDSSAEAELSERRISSDLPESPGLKRSPDLEEGFDLERSLDLEESSGREKGFDLNESPGLKRSPELNEGFNLERSLDLEESSGLEKNFDMMPMMAAAPMASASRQEENTPAKGSGKPKNRSLEDVIAQVSETFQQSLFRLIDEKGYTDTEVYKRANVDRKHFSKIRSNENYQPKKNTAVAFALALRLNMDETRDFLSRAGFALSPSSIFDLIIAYFIEQEAYDIYAINLALFEHDQPLLGK